MAVNSNTQSLGIRLFVAPFGKLTGRQRGVQLIGHSIAEGRGGNIRAQLLTHIMVQHPLLNAFEPVNTQLAGNLALGTPGRHIDFRVAASELSGLLSSHTEAVAKVHGDAVFLYRHILHIVEVALALRAGRFSQIHNRPSITLPRSIPVPSGSGTGSSPTDHRNRQ